MFKKYLVLSLLSLVLGGFLVPGLSAQAPQRWTSADIHKGIKKLNFLGSALYVAAHPDDENTRLIAYLANEKMAETAYLSLTRGDGGQNLIGPEIRELLGVIRTQELLAARRIDGGNQRFSRANDFGYSKHPDETLEIWNKDEVLSDVVWTIRYWQPDIIINRFDHRTPGRTHGHHTSSAILSYEAFDLAADKEVYPGQLEYVDPWQPKRLYHNTSWWFYGSREAFAKADKSNLDSVDVGVFYPMEGISNTEIAAASRSMHKCQGFGATPTRGTEMEYLERLKGDPTQDNDLFAGINTTWTRVKGGAPIGDLLEEIDESFHYENPAASVPQLLKVREMIAALPDGYWKRVKLREVESIIQGSLGLFAEAVAEEPSATPGEAVELSVEVINRSDIPVTLESVTFLPRQVDTAVNASLEQNVNLRFDKTVMLPGNIPYTSPYWLKKPWELGMYTVEDQQLRGLPETPRRFQARFDLTVDGKPLTITSDINYKETDPVAGEVYRPFEITPPVFANISGKVYIFADDEPRTVEVLVRAGKKDIAGSLRLRHPDGWRVEPEAVDFLLPLKGQDQRATFKVFPPEDQSEGTLQAIVEMDGRTYDQEINVIDYAHIPRQTVLLDNQSRVVRVGLRKAGEKVGYIMGAGDEIPASLQQIGYEVTLLDNGDVRAEVLDQFDAVIMGIRAYNTVDWLKFKQPVLLEYVEDGGTLIIQYNTNRGLVLPMEELAPFKLNVSRDRVSVEEAEMRILEPDHAVLNFPNEITGADFEGWVQERGLYFPDEWDEEKFTPIFSCNDPGESPKKGSLLVAPYGDGHYIYTGLSFFRELPAGVPGAFRLFANMISIGQKPKP